MACTAVPEASPAGRWRRTTGGLLGEAGEWIAYVSVTWVAYTSGGIPGAALLLLGAAVSFVLAGATSNRPRRGASLVSPAAILILMVQTSGFVPIDPPATALLGAALGAGAAWGGRGSAWAAGICPPPGPTGLISMAAAIGWLSFRSPDSLLPFAAALMLCGSLLGAAARPARRLAPPLIPAAAGAAFALGFRAEEPELVVASVAGAGVSDPLSTAIFALTWAASLRIGWLGARRLDARLILGAPFAAAASVAALGEVEGAGALFLYGAVGSLVGVVLGSEAGGDPGSKRSLLVLPTIVSVVWVGFAPSDLSFSAGGQSVVLLASGFVSLWMARRVPPPLRIPQPADELETSPHSTPAVRLPAIGVHEVELIEFEAVPTSDGADSILGAIAELRGALAYARVLRNEALQALRGSAESPADIARRRTLEVVSELEQGFALAGHRLQTRISTSETPTE